MNILYCGDTNTQKGIYLSVLSILKQTDKKLNIYIMTAGTETKKRTFSPIPKEFEEKLEMRVKSVNPKSQVVLIDATELFNFSIPTANIKTRFTPMCMLRLFADRIDEIPDKILYLDYDVLCRNDFSEFYEQDISDYDLAAVPDRYGRWFLGQKYINSGVLLLNMRRIRENGLFKKCTDLLNYDKMLMPDQTAINRLGVIKSERRRYNEQGNARQNTVFQHFSTRFKFFPYFKTQSVKPWNVEGMHNILKITEYDDLLTELSKEFEL